MDLRSVLDIDAAIALSPATYILIVGNFRMCLLMHTPEICWLPRKFRRKHYRSDKIKGI